MYYYCIVYVSFIYDAMMHILFKYEFFLYLQVYIIYLLFVYVCIYILFFYVSCICMLCLVLCLVYLCSLYIWYISYVCYICNIQGLWWTEQVWTSIKGTTNLQPGGGRKMQKLIVIMFNVVQWSQKTHMWTLIMDVDHLPCLILNLPNFGGSIQEIAVSPFSQGVANYNLAWE